MLWVCGRCGTKYAVGLPYCPQCTSTDYREDGEEMAKNTVHGGPSDQFAEPGQPGYQPPAEPAETPEAVSLAEATISESADQEPEPMPETEAQATVRELRERLRARGLSVSGSKDELRDRLAEAEAGEG
jgi:predicted  nucleic acid-binding Zn-ribbon protein